jgi:exopolyphosphatase/pppGpp-phosphohydrolase
MKTDRADISLGGAMVVHEVMRTAGFEDMTICSQGLREGCFTSVSFGNGGTTVAERTPMFEDVKRATILNLSPVPLSRETRRADRRLTLSMFDQLPGDRHLCREERELLWQLRWCMTLA